MLRWRGDDAFAFDLHSHVDETFGEVFEGMFFTFHPIASRLYNTETNLLISDDGAVMCKKHCDVLTDCFRADSNTHLSSFNFALAFWPHWHKLCITEILHELATK